MKYNPVTGDVIQALQQITGENMSKPIRTYWRPIGLMKALAPDMWQSAGSRRRSRQYRRSRAYHEGGEPV